MDFVLSLRVPIANQPLMLLVLGLVMAVVYYFTFMFVIKKFNLMTPGREESSPEDFENEETIAAGDDKFAVMAGRLYEALGGIDNITSIDNCTTRLRLQVKDTSLVDQDMIKKTGVPGQKLIDATNYQVIVGTEVQFVADALAQLHGQPVKTTGAYNPSQPEAVEIAKKQEIYSVANGTIIPIEEVNDDVFSNKMMGDGFAVIPTNGDIFAPIAGKVLSVFPTKHAVGIQTASGIEVLLHMGIDTVSLNGEPFTVYIEEGQQIARGQLIATVDLQALEEANRSNDMIVIFTNGDLVEDLEINTGESLANEVIGSVESK